MRPLHIDHLFDSISVVAAFSVTTVEVLPHRDNVRLPDGSHQYQPHPDAAGGKNVVWFYSIPFNWQGNILASESITMDTGAVSCGRLLAGAYAAGAFVFDSNVVSVPGSPSAPAGCI